ncbi:MAG: hypothetical protein A3J54_00130 [Candidatus Ryanbacteria bacterium RIFCSPHIGHO2_02_FULL_45_13b]|uniref:Uncharacterized protein n=1 Tax=Candidatus Ryanbacteria bacterium RIFCSPHIGHO2_02_FULL_45_13b TaxID=1802117 RepID=A0A1G2G9I6_9BACT|nr:MAG: hypothetical protein A3J54_00130 [Candidatus Ryanbacteria bacterium RIFCSPHIGHO2_02_FULL_45_13b]
MPMGCFVLGSLSTAYWTTSSCKISLLARAGRFARAAECARVTSASLISPSAREAATTPFEAILPKPDPPKAI